MQPGGAYELTQFVDVENAKLDSEGTMSLMTVSMSTATPFTYAVAKISSRKELLPETQVRSPHESENDYNLRQLKLMTDSQFNAKYVAFQKANKDYEINYNGVYVVYVLENGASKGILKAGDKVIGIDGQKVKRQTELIDYLNGKKSGDQVTLSIIRDKKEQTKSVTLKEIPGTESKVGIGITFTENKSIATNPKVKIEANDIGGPSAGLMFTLEIIDQLTEGDLTKGYNIAGTGEMLESGQVGRIGGMDKKVIAADEGDIEIFFAPDDTISDEVKKLNPSIKTNYEIAVETAKKIDTKMKIVPVKTVDDALKYLNDLKQK
ncbi:PDZ domain-containing protein [Viridibacillus sp. YIM B01967]|uniref:endopeptidase La n=2 Tax=Viridibacillus soli TaxID=2798301 RepID=A0ABS1H7Q8_9BACL|nr:PDZ domain-containing protein [Viridibacillus soli]